MGIFSRKPVQPQSLVAAGSRVNPDDRSEVKKTLERRQAWQEEAWDFFDAVGEVKQALNFMANALRKVRLFVAERPEGDPDGDPIPATNIAAVTALDRLRSGLGDHGELLAGFALNLNVAGECYLLGQENDDGDEEFTVRSVSEFQLADGKAALVDPDNPSKRNKIEGEDVFFARVWLQHPRFRDKADSPLHGVLSTCEQILILERAIRVARRNRAILRGILGLPSEGTFGPQDPTQEGDERKDPFMKAFEEHVTAAILDENSMAAASPVILRMAGEHLDKAKLLQFEDKIEGMLDEQKDNIQRLGQGLNIPPEVIKGIADTNHWQAWLVRDETWSAHFEPLTQQALAGLTSAFLRPQLQAANVEDASRFFIWYDASRLIVRPERGKDADDAFDRGALKWDAYRKAKGFDEDDAPDPEELAAIAAFLGSKRPVAEIASGQEDTNEDAEQAPPEEQPETEEPQTEAVTAALEPSLSDEEEASLGMVCLMPTPDQAATIAREGGNPSELLHVTLAFLGETADLEGDLLERIQTVSASVARSMSEIEGRVGGLGHFAEFEGRQPCLGLVDVPGLVGLRTILVNELIGAGVELPSEHDFTPHMTLGHHAAGDHDDSIDDDVLGQPLTFSELIVRIGTEETRYALAGEEVAAASPPPSDLGARLFQLDQQLKQRLHVLADITLSRALEKAGARIKSKTNGNRMAREAIAGASLDQVARRLGPSLVATLGLDETQLVEDSIASLEPRFNQWTLQTQRKALDAIPDLTDSERTALEAIQDADRKKAWAWLSSTLTALAVTRLYEPVGEMAGEFDPTSTVPFGLIREGVARAGGDEANLPRSKVGAVGGIATGQVIVGAFQSKGARVEGYEWVYGVFPRNSFEPHAALDGAFFENFDDPILSNTYGWPETPSFYPGDHDGCTCDFMPAISLPNESDTQDLALAAGGA